MPGGDVGGPGVYRGLKSVISGLDGVEAFVSLIPRHRLGDLAVAQLGQHPAFLGVVLAAVLHQVVALAAQPGLNLM
ncbi:MAG: hypothetical protein M3R71_03080 [Actinomycetota bacterium]|nr:hypothetical protein [Actinomycetota bacterium]